MIVGVAAPAIEFVVGGDAAGMLMSKEYFDPTDIQFNESRLEDSRVGGATGAGREKAQLSVGVCSPAIELLVFRNAAAVKVVDRDLKPFVFACHWTGCGFSGAPVSKDSIAELPVLVGTPAEEVVVSGDAAGVLPADLNVSPDLISLHQGWRGVEAVYFTVT